MMDKIIEGYIACAENEWKKVIRDTQWHSKTFRQNMRDLGAPHSKWTKPTEGDRGHIARIIRTNGGHWEKVMRKRGYSEAKGDAWCGLGIGHCMRNVGDWIEPGMCVDLTLRRGIAEHVLPSTARIASRTWWARAGGRRIDGKKVRPDGIQRGDVITVFTGSGKSYGDHYAIALDSPYNGSVKTIEFNGYGELGDGTFGEGVIKRERKLKDVKRIYRFGPQHFEGEYGRHK